MSGWCYLLSTVTRDRWPWFKDSRAAWAVADLHEASDLFGDATLVAWVIMPDHWHGVIRLGDETSLASAMNRFKTRAAIAANAVLERNGPLWARGFHDRALRNEREARAAIEYVGRNPERAGLCVDGRAYPWMGCVADVMWRR